VVKWRPIIVVGLTCAAVAAIAVWVVHARQVGYWLQLHTGTINEPGPYYGFWSGFGSDLEEFGILGGIAAGVYQLVKKHNCHEPGCWRVGQYPAADGQFMLCYRHHPDYRGSKPTHELIERLHREHLERQAAIHGKLHEAHNHRTSGRAAAHDPSSDVRHGATRPSATASPDLGLGSGAMCGQVVSRPLVRGDHDHIERGPWRCTWSEGRRDAQLEPTVGERQAVSELCHGGGLVEQ
jgi:hypothetical protein